MEQKNKIYEFRALTTSNFIIAMSVWLVCFFAIYISMDKLLFYDEKRVDALTNLKTVGVPLILSSIVELIISHYLISSKYKIQLNENSIVIIKNKKKNSQIPLNEIDSIELGISNTPVIGSVKIRYKENNYVLFNGFFSTFYKEKKVLEKIIIDEINPYFDNKVSFKLEKKENSNGIAYIYTKR